MILVVAPWSALWDRNLLYFTALPALGHLMASPFLRGGVSGIGVITVIAGLAELAGLLAVRHRQPQDAPRVEL